ncbi:MAG: adenylosuccinate synthetase [Gammaproteobacteria bacterium]|nr:adenylosuccinate synthetase [Gammaproteobacteria bacterium]
MCVEKTAQVVIGAQFGDEGKGRWVDHHAAQIGHAGLVVRFNGGAQAGHTVVASDGRRHVFSHVGSGAFAGAATFLSRFFVSNPILFLKEWERLAALGMQPVIQVDPSGAVTTPYDMMINQIIEKRRGDGRHGSCGIGFGETLERHLNPTYTLTVADLAKPALADRLNAIRRDYAPARLARLGFGDAVTGNADLFQCDAILEHYVEDTQRFLAAVTVTGLQTAAQSRSILFEGAQGLLLDQDRGFFPYVTRSHTGLRNVLALAEELALERLEVTYATRAYLTRHGAGPLPGELPNKPYPGVSDLTNVPNDYQGTLRFAWLDLDLLGRAIAGDLADADRVSGLLLHPHLAVTCLDQLGDGPAIYHQDGRRRQARQEEFVAKVAETAGTKVILMSFGPGREAVSGKTPGVL